MNIHFTSRIQHLIISGLVFLLASSTGYTQTYLNANAPVNDRVEDLLSQMTLAEKIGQMTLVAEYVINGGPVVRDHLIGAFLTGAGNEPGNGSNSAWADFSDQVQSYALQTRLSIPILHGIDAVHGNNSADHAVIFPHNIGLGCMNDTTLFEQAYAVTAAEVSGTGTKWTFAPCIAVARDERWGRTYESYSESPTLVSTLSRISVRGLQGNNLSNPERILGCAKHLLADGGTLNGVNAGDAVLTEAELREIHLPPFRAAVNQKVGSVMASFSSWNGLHCHGSYFLITQLLKQELGFEGFVVSDWEGINHLTSEYWEAIRLSINAGIDMVMVPANYPGFIDGMTYHVNNGSISIERVNDAVRRILKQKFLLGLFERPYTDRSLTAQIGTQSHKDVARACVRNSLVLLKNENDVLPIAKSATHIHVGGKSADDIGNQCGGWTVTWQGGSGNIRSGTTVLEAIRQQAQGQVTFALDASGGLQANVGVVVIGETPYAETNGDDSDLSLAQEDIEAVMNMKSQGIPTVVILISGRPMILDPILNYADAIVAAWLPGSEGAGITDVLFGDYEPAGTLSFSWPAHMGQVPINSGDAHYNPLYEFGYGITEWTAGPVITAVSHTPDNPKSDDEVSVSARVNDPMPVSSVSLEWGLTESLGNTRPMTVSEGSYHAAIPPQTHGVLVFYRIKETNTAGGEHLSSTRQYQVSDYRLFADYENVHLPFSGFDGSSFSVVENPNIGAGNVSSHVGRSVRGTATTWSGIYSEVLSPKIDFASDPAIRVKVFLPKASSVMLKLEDHANAENSFEVSEYISTANTWVDVIFNCSEAPSNVFDRIVLFFDLGSNNGLTYYFDDIAQDNLVITETPVVSPREDDFVVYPNPTTGHLFVSTPASEQPIDLLQVYDLQGHLLKQWLSSQDEETSGIDCSGLNAGAYFLKISHQGGVAIKKLVIEQ